MGVHAMGVHTMGSTSRDPRHDLKDTSFLTGSRDVIMSVLNVCFKCIQSVDHYCKISYKYNSNAEMFRRGHLFKAWYVSLVIDPY